jgi:hypothetical protein
MVVCAALVVPPWSSVYTPQDLANRLVALDFGNGTAYAGLQMLEGAMPRAAIKTRSFDTSPARRYAALMAGEFEATGSEKSVCNVHVLTSTRRNGAEYHDSC